MYCFISITDTNKGIDQCYSRNSAGNQFGNCGHSFSQDQYLPCASGDEMCGLLFCQEGDFNNVDNIFTTIITVSSRDNNGDTQQCRASVVSANSDFINPGLVDDGTRCGDQNVRPCIIPYRQMYCVLPVQVCWMQRCVPLSSLNIPACPVGSNGLTCSGSGVREGLNCNYISQHARLCFDNLHQN